MVIAQFPNLENSISLFFYFEYLVGELRISGEIVFYKFKNIYCLLPFKCLHTELVPEYLHNWTFYRSEGTCSICLGRKMWLANNTETGPRLRTMLSPWKAFSFTLQSVLQVIGQRKYSTSLQTRKKRKRGALLTCVLQTVSLTSSPTSSWLCSLCPVSWEFSNSDCSSLRFLDLMACC